MKTLLDKYTQWKELGKQCVSSQALNFKEYTMLSAKVIHEFPAMLAELTKIPTPPNQTKGTEQMNKLELIKALLTEDMPRTKETIEKATVVSPWVIGAPYLIRTVTHIQTGRVVMVTPQEIVLEEAAWIADTGRFADAIKKAEFNEVEPFPSGQVIVGRGAVIDAVQIQKLPREQK